MGGFKKAINRISSDELIAESLPKRPIIELCGDTRLYIERHLGVYEYSQDEIHIGTCFGKLVVRGCSLKLSSMSKECLIINGQIQCVEMIRG